MVVTLFEHFYREDQSQTPWSEKVSRYEILWVLIGVYFALRIYFLGAALASRVNLDLKFSQVLVSAAALIGQYAWKLLWPARLCAYYLFLSDWRSLRIPAPMGAPVLLASGVFIRLQWKRDRLPTFALVWFFATIAPVLNPRWLAANIFAERYAYLRSITLVNAALAFTTGIAPELATTHEVYLVQVNGFGGDAPGENLKPGILTGMAADLDELIRSRKLTHVAVVGHSMGGIAGLLLSARDPACVERLMVVDELHFAAVMRGNRLQLGGVPLEHG